MTRALPARTGQTPENQQLQLGCAGLLAITGHVPDEVKAAARRDLRTDRRPQLRFVPPTHADFGPGDVRHAQADISRALRLATPPSLNT